MRSIALLLTLPLASLHAATIPTRFEADRVFATPTTADGQSLRLYTDTGGGANLLCRKAALRLRLPLEPLPPDAELEAELGSNLARATLPEFRADAGIPANADGDGSLLVHECKDRNGASAASLGEGLLSQHWFAGRVWTWDYPARRLTLEDAGWKAPSAAHRAPLGFKPASDASPAFHMPRITVRIDGRDLDLLLDTGATGYPTRVALAAQPAPAPVNGARATSFITTSTLDAWHAAHPDWTVVGNADDLLAPRLRARAIRVPQVEIAGWTVGPVWFTERPDPAFRTMMSSMTDRPVEGALGGNALAAFRMTLDYPGAAAYFVCARGCKEATPPPGP